MTRRNLLALGASILALAAGAPAGPPPEPSVTQVQASDQDSQNTQIVPVAAPVSTNTQAVPVNLNVPVASRQGDVHQSNTASPTTVAVNDNSSEQDIDQTQLAFVGHPDKRC